MSPRRKKLAIIATAGVAALTAAGALLGVSYTPTYQGVGGCAAGGSCTPATIVTTGDITAGDDLVSTDDVEVGDDVKLTDGNKTFYNVGATMHVGGDGFGVLVLDAPVSILLDAATDIRGTTLLGHDKTNYLTFAGGNTGLQPSITQTGEAGVGLLISGGTGPVMLGSNFSVDAAGNVSAVEGGFSDVVTALSGVDFGGSDIITESQSCSGTLNFGSIAAGTDAELTFTCTGAAVGDAVVPIWPTTIESGLVGMMWVSASNTMRVRLSNIQLVTAIDPASQSFAARTFNP